MKKVTARQIIDNINARLALLKSQKAAIAYIMQLQELLDDICRHNTDIENIDESIKRHQH